LAELRDDHLFSQPDGSHLGECPICCLPLPLDENKSGINSCCCKIICDGCNYANQLREKEQGMKHSCPYCREPILKTDKETDQNLVKRVKANDAEALSQTGLKRYDEGDCEGAVKYFSKAAELGHADAHYNLSTLYHDGKGVEKDTKKKIYHLEEAAIGGHPNARYNLGCSEIRNERYERATKHFIIAAKQGHDGALEMVKEAFAKGFVSKEEYASALRGHQAAVDATKSAQRDAVEAFCFCAQNYHL
jgi:tetratricopeptide (TPR) repeat protein